MNVNLLEMFSTIRDFITRHFAMKGGIDTPLHNALQFQQNCGILISSSPHDKWHRLATESILFASLLVLYLISDSKRFFFQCGQ